MDIKQEIKISENQPVIFFYGTEMAELYKALKKRWKLDEEPSLVFAASVFYSMGRVHGIREERARRKHRENKQEDDAV